MCCGSRAATGNFAPARGSTAWRRTAASPTSTTCSADYTDTYVRYRSGDTRLTLGAQTIIWGRVDEIPLADRVSRADLTRFVLDDLPDRRRAELAARWEQTFGDYKLDAVWLPVFRGAQLPDVASVWSPINLTTGEIIGIAPVRRLPHW